MANKTSDLSTKVDQSIEDVRKTVGRLASSNNALAEEVVILKQNYNQLVEDINARFKLVHDKLFRPGSPRSGAETL